MTSEITNWNEEFLHCNLNKNRWSRKIYSTLTTMNSILLSRLLRRDFNFTEQFRFHAGIFHSHVSFWAVWNKSGKLCLLFAEKKENSSTSKSWSDASQYVDTSHQRIEPSQPNMKRFQVDSIHMSSGLIAHSTIIGRQTSQLKPSELQISLFLLRYPLYDPRHRRLMTASIILH